MAGSILIRVDSSPAIGAGHMARCRSLAQGFVDRGGKVTFATAQALPGTAELLGADAFRHEPIAVDPGGREDVTETAGVARRHNAGLIVLDGPGFAGPYQDGLARAGFPLVMLDDNADLAPYRAKVIVNQNIHAAKTLYPRHVEAMCGPRFVMLRREFRTRTQSQSPVREAAERVLVTLGGTDPLGATAIVIEAFNQVPAGNFQLGVIVGSGNPHLDAINKAAEASPHRVAVRGSVADMSAAMASADIAVSAAGSTLWELAYMGVPTIALIVAEGQRPAAEAYAAQGCGVALDLLTDKSSAPLAGQIAKLMADAELRQRYASHGRQLIDGMGVVRVCQKIEALLFEARARR